MMEGTRMVTAPFDLGTAGPADMVDPMLFQGCCSLHRVAPMRGRRRRLPAILGFTMRPGQVGARASSVLHDGPRVAALAAARGEARVS